MLSSPLTATHVHHSLMCNYSIAVIIAIIQAIIISNVVRASKPKEMYPYISHYSGNNEEARLKQALEMSMQVDAPSSVETEVKPVVAPDVSSMTEEQEIAYAMQMSLAADAGTLMFYRAGIHFTTRRFCVLSNKKLYHRNLLL